MNSKSISSQYASPRFHKFIMWLWIFGCLATVVSSQSQFYLKHFGKKKEIVLPSQIQPDVRLERSVDGSIKKKLLRTYAIDPRMNRIFFGNDGYKKRALTLPSVPDDYRAVNFNNLQQSEAAAQYLDHLIQMARDADAAADLRQDFQQEGAEDVYDNFRIELSDGRLDEEGPVFFNIEDRRNSI